MQKDDSHEEEPLDNTQPVQRPNPNQEETRPNLPEDRPTIPSRPDPSMDVTRPSASGDDLEDTGPLRFDSSTADTQPFQDFGGLEDTLPYLPDENPEGRYRPDPLSSLQPVRLPGRKRPVQSQPPVPPTWQPQEPEYPPPPPPSAQPRRYPAQPYDPYAYPPPPPPPAARAPRRRRGLGCNCGCMLFPFLIVLALLLVYLLAPLRTNILVLGIDRAPEGTWIGRSDTNILVTVVPLKPTVAMLSVPRDLWVNVANVGPQRINTAHFFAEADQTGSGPQGAIQTFESNFHVSIPYYVRVNFDSLVGVVDAMGGVDINLPEPTSGYTAGVHHLNGTQALAFARDRKGADDFFRMEHGQFLIRSMFKQMLKPTSWFHLPAVTSAAFQAMDTNLPIWQWPRLGLAVLRAGPDGIDSRTLNRDMVTPWTTDEGANVLLPNWEAIDPVVREMFGSYPLLTVKSAR